MSRFLIKFSAFCLPFLVVFSVLGGLLVQAGEFRTPAEVAALQAEETPIIYGPIVTRETVLVYKLRGMLEHHPEVAIAGSSRVLQFRSEFLGDNADLFYNAGGSGWHIRETRTFVENLTDESRPRILIIGIDQNHFEASFPMPTEDVDMGRGLLDPSHVLSATRSFVETMMDSTRSESLNNIMDGVDPVSGAQAMGIAAVRYGFGYRNDGSRQRGREISNPNRMQSNRDSAMRSWTNDRRTYEWSDEAAEYTLGNIRQILEIAEAEGMYVIGFTPPYMPSLYEWMNETDSHQYIMEAPSHIQTLFDEYGYPFYDFTDAVALGGSDDEMIDHWHATELLSLRMFRVMVAGSEEEFAPYVDLAYLDNLIESAENPLQLFEY